MTQPLALVIDDEPDIRELLTLTLGRMDIRTETAADVSSAKHKLGATQFDLCLTDMRLPDGDGLELVEWMQANATGVPVAVITAHGNVETAVQALKLGAFDFISKPLDLKNLRSIVENALRIERGHRSRDSQLIGHSEPMQQLRDVVDKVARSQAPVHISGESGTGKELVARALHEHSPRAHRPFVALNTSAIASELLESELFGHEKGAFTGADSRRIGRFEQADGGTLFLDEIGDMSPALQTRLLRVLAEREFYRVGGQQSIKVDVRVIAATNQDLARAVKESRFREDLYHRLNVIRINTPPLRARRGDIPLLFNHYLAAAAKELDTPVKSIDADALDLLQSYDWPGNVRQLVNATRRLTVTAPGAVITPEDIPLDIGGGERSQQAVQDWTRSLAAWAEKQLSSRSAAPLLDAALPEFEKTLIRIALSQTNGHRQDAARLLGWGRNTLTRKMKALQLD